MFTIEDLTLIKFYSGETPDKEKFIANVLDVFDLIEEDEMKEQLTKIINKAKTMSDDEFAALDLSNTLDIVDDE